MVVVAVARNRHVELAHAQRVERRHHHALARVETFLDLRPHVVQQGVSVRTHQHRQPLADIQHHDVRFAMRRQPARGPQQRQPQQPRQRLAGNAARQQQPECAEQRQRQREPARLRQPPQRERRFRQCLEHRPRQVEGHRRERPQPGTRTRVQRLQRGAEQRQRHHDQAPPRHRHQVGERPGERSLAEQHHGERQQSERGDRLRAEEIAQRVPVRLGQAPQQPGHAGEAEPETRRQRRQRIGQQHRDRGQRECIAHRLVAPPQARGHHDRDHQQRAHRGQREAGHGRVRRTAGRRRQSRRLRSRPAPRQARPQPPQPARGEREEARRQADVETRDRDQVGEPVGAQHVPVGIVQSTGIPQRQRPHEARRRRVDRIRDPHRHAVAPGIDAAPVREPSRRFRIADIAAGGNPLRQRMPLDVESPRIAQAARRAQPELQSPALAGMHAGARSGFVRPPIVVPGQLQQAAAQGCRRIVLHPETETGPTGLHPRQVDHAAGKHELPAFQLGRKLPVQAHRRMQPRQAEPEQQRPGQPRAPAAQPQPASAGEREREPRPCRQRRQQQAAARTCQQRHRRGDAEGRAH